MPRPAAASAPAAVRGKIWQAAALILLGVVAYWPAIRAGWIWDDDLYFTGNPLLRTAAGLGGMWTGPSGVNYFPVASSFAWLEWQLWGNNPAAFHAVNIALHLAAAFLVWRLLAQLFELSGSAPVREGRALGPWVGALVFALHPLATESVVWAAELKNMLSTVFLLLAASAFVAYDADGENRHYYRSLACFLAAMLSKSTVAMLPVCLILYLWWRRRRIARPDWIRLAPYFGIALVLGVLGVVVEHRLAVDEEVVPVWSLAARLAGSGIAAVFYLGKSAVPWRLAPMYPRWELGAPGPAQFLPWIALGTLFLWLASRRTRGAAHALLGLGFFSINLLPILGFVRMSYWRVSWVADHFAYLPLVGLAGLAAAGVAALGRRPSFRTFAVPTMAMVAVIMVLSVRNYAALFHDQETLWSRTLARNPGAWLAENNLGYALQEKGWLEEAVSHYQAALRLEPRSALARYNLANCLARAGRLDEAIAPYREALRIRPGFVQARNNLGNVLSNLTRFDEAAAEFREVVRLNPDYAEARSNLGEALARSGKLPEAEREMREAERLRPGSAQIHLNLGNVLFMSGRREEAAAEYRRALALDPRNRQARQSLDTALGRTKR